MIWIVGVALMIPTAIGASASLDLWANQVVLNGGRSSWEQDLAWEVLLREGHFDQLDVRLTFYSPDDQLDPGTGGGPWGAWWLRGKGIRLRWGHIAAAPCWPKGTILYAPPPFNRLWIVVDRGPGVRRRSHLDVCCLTTRQRDLVLANQRLKVVVLSDSWRRLTWKEAH